jgi:phage terminase large subunit-like protein
VIYADTVRPAFGLPWPRFELKDYTSLPADEPAKDWELKQRIEELAHKDPVKFGWVLESWVDVCENWEKYKIHVLLGGNRSGKSSFAARLTIWLLENIPECRIRCYHVNDDKSIAEQQAYVWEALPDRYKHMDKKRGQAHSIQYTQQNGFVGSKLILPPQEGCRRGSEIIFGNYQQYRNDAQVIEGWWAHFIWGDEEVPQKMFDRLLTRLYDARGRILITFTTVQGWSPLISDVLGRTRTLKKRRSELVGRNLPIVQESLTRPGTRISYAWTQDNPFIPAETIEFMRGRPEAEILAIAHGIPTKNALTKFPKFRDDVHVIKSESLPWERAVREGRDPPEVVYYNVIDPGGSKPWFCIWAGVDQYDDIYVFKEFPDGVWGEPSEKTEGSPGPAQKPLGWGIQDYKAMLEDMEYGFEVFERIIDPRMGASPSAGQEGATNLITELEDAGFVLRTAPGQRIEHGEALINDRLSYDENEPVGPKNRPRIFITENCMNTVEAIKNYTGCSRHEVWKDPIDCIRYLLENGCDFFSRTDEARSDAGYHGSY